VYAITSSAVTGVDWLIVAFTALLALYGFMQGFIVGVLSLVGFAAGAFLGTRVGPLLLPSGSRSPYAPLSWRPDSRELGCARAPPCDCPGFAPSTVCWAAS
jgi:hypothetical protein